MRLICQILAERKLSQKQAAAKLGIDQPEVSALLRGRMNGFSSDRFFRFLNALDNDIEIIIRPVSKPRHSGGAQVRSLSQRDFKIFSNKTRQSLRRHVFGSTSAESPGLMRRTPRSLRWPWT